MKALRTWLLVLTVVTLHPSLIAAAFMKFDGIDGEATSKDHRNWIDVESFSGLPAGDSAKSARAGAADLRTGKQESPGAGMSTGRRTHSPIVFTKRIDKASPKLAEALASGTRLKTVTLSHNGQRFEMEDVVITSIKPQANNMESISFNYTKIRMMREAKSERAKGDPDRPVVSGEVRNPAESK